MLDRVTGAQPIDQLAQGQDASAVQSLAADALDVRRLRAFLGRRLRHASAIRLSEVVAVAQGLSRDHFLFDLEWSSDGQRRREPLVLIRDGERPGQTDRGSELRLLRKLGQTGIPAPRAFWCDTSGRWLQRPFIIMERVRGNTTPPFTVAYEDDPEARERLAQRFLDILVRIHTLNWRRLRLHFLGVPPCALADYAAHRLAEAEAGVAEAGADIEPQVARALAWCRSHTPRTQALTLCHGDYKPDNVMHEDGRVIAVIDWERAYIGDPMADLAYVCLPYLSAGGLVVGLMERQRFLEAYQKGTGFRVEEETIRFWQLFLLVITIYYFKSLIADAQERGLEPPPLEPFITLMLGLIDAQLG